MIKSTVQNKHTVDFLFVVILFFVFTLSAVGLVTLGANVYSGTVSAMDDNFNKRTAYMYITEKVRTFDSDGAVSFSKFGDGDALCLTQSNAQNRYITYLYIYEDSLCEITAKEGSTYLAPENGTAVLPQNSMTIESVSGSQYKVNLVDENNNMTSFFIHYSSVEKE